MLYIYDSYLEVVRKWSLMLRWSNAYAFIDFVNVRHSFTSLFIGFKENDELFCFTIDAETIIRF